MTLASIILEPPHHAFRYVWIAFGISAILAWPLLILMRRIKAHAMISQYTPEHAGKAGTPSMGGIAPLIATIVAVTMMPRSVMRDAVLAALVGFGLLGFVDDFLIPRLMPGKRGLGWTQKLIVQFIIAGLVGWLAVPNDTTQAIFTALLCLFFANAVNFADGLDALCGGLLVITMATLAAIGEASFPLTIAAALIPFLVLNAPPAKIFMGDVGALPFGAAYGVIVALPLTDPFLGVANVLAIVAVSAIFILELVLVPMQIFWVKAFKKRLIPASPVHHSFEKIGWPETRITAFFLLAQLTLGLICITLHTFAWWSR